MFRTRYLAGGLAAAAVTSALTLAGPGAFAAPGEGRECGLPAVPAVTRTVTIDPVLETVPAVTHTEWLWGRDLAIDEFEFLRILKDARAETDWSRIVAGPLEFLYTRTVIDSPAVPAVPGTPEVTHTETYEITPAVTETLVEYRQQTTGNLRWESEDWGAKSGKGWEKTGNTKLHVLDPAVTGTRTVVDSPAIPGSPAIPAVTHEETQWASTDPGASWTGPTDSRPGTSSTEYATTDGTQPAGTGWVAGETRTFDAVTETGWAETVPADATPTGASRVARTEHEETDAPSAEAPAGTGWTKVADSAVTVTDVEAKQVMVTPGSVTEVEVSPALPATDPCPEAPTGATDPIVETPQAGPQETVSVSPATVLPNTGGVAGWMIPAGLATALAGAIVVRGSRTRGAEG